MGEGIMRESATPRISFLEGIAASRDAQSKERAGISFFECAGGRLDEGESPAPTQSGSAPGGRLAEHESPGAIKKV
jgi:hypothetical protein